MPWRRQQAIQIAAQLPENPEDARIVLNYARLLVDTFLAKDWDAPEGASEGPPMAPAE